MDRKRVVEEKMDFEPELVVDAKDPDSDPEDLLAGAAPGEIPGKPPLRPFDYEVVKVIVTDPKKVGDGINGYTIYTVSSQIVPDEAATAKEFNVTRRYRDFRWLRSKLKLNFPGYVIPPIPDKKIIGKFSARNVEKRQKGLEKFLLRVSKHPVLQKSWYFHQFISASEDEFLGVQDKEKATTSSAPARSSSGKTAAAAPSYFSLDFLKSSIQSFSASLRSVPVVEKTQDDFAFDTLSAYNKDLIKYLQSAHANSTSLRKASKEVSEAWFELGLACAVLGQAEAKNGHPDLIHVLKQIGNGADRTSVVLTKKFEDEENAFEEPLDDLGKTAQAVQDVIDARAEALQKYVSALNLHDTNKTELASARDKGKADKISAAEKAVAESEALVEERKSFLDSVTKSAFEEVSRFRAEKVRVLKDITVQFLKVQVEYSRKMSALWEDVLHKVEEEAKADDSKPSDED